VPWHKFNTVDLKKVAFEGIAPGNQKREESREEEKR